MVENNIPIYILSNKRLIKILCGLIILASGIVIGSGATILMVKHRVIWVSKSHKDANEITNKITTKYALTPQQAEQIKQIINKAFAQKKMYDDAQDKQRDEYSKIFIAEMNSVMTPEQFERWNTDFQAMRDKFKKRK